jgi:hypothetical protein
MALRQCRECGGRVSSKAAACPSCGAPLKRAARKSTIGGCSGCLIVLVALVICAGLFNLGDRAVVGPKPDVGREPANAGAKAAPANAVRANTGAKAPPANDAKAPPANAYGVVRNALDAEVDALIDQYPRPIRGIDDKAVERQFDFVKKSKTERQFTARSLQLQRMTCFCFARSHPEKTKSDVDELKKKLKEMNERLAQTLADLIHNGQIEVDTSEPTVAADNREQGNAAAKADDEIDVDGLVLLRKSVEGKRGEITGEITGTVINRRDHKLSYAQISFNLYDASGAQVGSAIANINGLEPGGRWNFKATTFGADFVRYKFSDLSGF